MKYLMVMVKKNRFVWALAALVIGFTALSCSKDNDPGPEDEESLKQEIGSITGLGEQSGIPQGATFKLPDGIVVDGDIFGDDCEDAEESIGSGYYVTICVALRNDKDQAVTVTFPGGLVFISESGDYQHGMVMETTTIVLPPKKTTRFTFHTYCGNASRSAASRSASYRLGPITNSVLIAKLVNDLKGKRIAAMDYWDGNDYSDTYYELEEIVQELVWLITDSPILTNWEVFETNYKQLLAKLPNK